ncbi:hypothetical protein ACF1AJ_20470 [Leifsonia sp. NPDC014704]|uniref:hypothetical protein n=1 Tax=Leifsonia sp. NPDC014704 TaxID=3364123 RepID=UPI0036F48319
MSPRLQHSRTGVIVNVSEERAARLDSEWGPVGAKPTATAPVKGTPAPTGSSEAPDASWKVADLKAYADERGIELAGATRKDDILAAIAAGEKSGTPAPEGTDGATGATGAPSDDNDDDDESDEDEDNSDDSDDESNS